MTNAALQGSDHLADRCEREREVLAVLVREGGHARQQDVCDAFDIKRQYVARYIDDLDDAGHLEKVPLGRANVVFLPGCEPDIVQPTLMEAGFQ